MRMHQVICLALGLVTIQTVCEGADYSRSHCDLVIEQFLSKPPIIGCEATSDPITDETLGDAFDCGNVITLLKDRSIPVPTRESIAEAIAWKLSDMNLEGNAKYLISMAFVKFYSNRFGEVSNIEQKDLTPEGCDKIRCSVQTGDAQFERIIADCDADQPHEHGQYAYMKLSLMKHLKDAGFGVGRITNSEWYEANVGLSRLCHPKIVHEIMTWTTRNLIGEWANLFCRASSCEILKALSSTDLNIAATPTFVTARNITETEKHLKFFSELKIPDGEHTNPKFEIANCVFVEAMWTIFSKKETYLGAIRRVLTTDQTDSDPVFLDLAFGLRPSRDYIQRNVGGALWKIILHENDQIWAALNKSRVEQPWRRDMSLPQNGEYCTLLNTLEEADTWNRAVAAYRELT